MLQPSHYEHFAAFARAAKTDVSACVRHTFFIQGSLPLTSEKRTASFEGCSAFVAEEDFSYWEIVHSLKVH